MEEVGNTNDLNNVVVDVTVDDEYITMTDSTETIGTMTAGSTIDLTNAFAFEVSENVPDNYDFNVQITITSDEGSWGDELSFTAFAANIHMESMTLDDGDNGILDPGETATIIMEFMNTGGADVYNVGVTLSTSNSYVVLEMLPFQIDSINTNGMATAEICTVTLDENAPLGEIVDFELDITADNGYITDNDFSIVTGLIIENFETGDFSAFDWNFAGDADWVIDTESYEGVYCAKSGSIGNNQETTLEITLNVADDGNISFWRKVSSESDYDYLRFYIDDELQEEWSGEEDWNEQTYAVGTGEHTFAWTYSKDQGVTGGDDCAWIDYIIFPNLATEGNSYNQVVTSAALIGNYPNPFNPTTTIKFSTTNSNELTRIEIYNLKGQKVKQLVNAQLSAGEHSVIWNGTDDNGKAVSSGVYFYKLKTDKKEISKKMLLLK